MKKAIYILLSLSLLVLYSCSKDSCNENSDFCDFVYDDKLDETLPLINSFLEDLDYNYDKDDYDAIEVNLIKLKEWFECKECVDSVVILCNSCIETIPLQSELKIYYNAGNENNPAVLDVESSQPMQAAGYH